MEIVLKAVEIKDGRLKVSTMDGKTYGGFAEDKEHNPNPALKVCTIGNIGQRIELITKANVSRKDGKTYQNIFDAKLIEGAVGAPTTQTIAPDTKNKTMIISYCKDLRVAGIIKSRREMYSEAEDMLEWVEGKLKSDDVIDFGEDK